MKLVLRLRFMSLAHTQTLRLLSRHCLAALSVSNQSDESVAGHPHPLVSRLPRAARREEEKKKVPLARPIVNARKSRTGPERMRAATIFERCRLPTRIYLHFAHLSIDTCFRKSREEERSYLPKTTTKEQKFSEVLVQCNDERAERRKKSEFCFV